MAGSVEESAGQLMLETGEMWASGQDHAATRWSLDTVLPCIFA